MKVKCLMNSRRNNIRTQQHNALRALIKYDKGDIEVDDVLYIILNPNSASLREYINP